MMKAINLGCGFKKYKNDDKLEWTNIDKSDEFNPDLKLNFDNEYVNLPFENNSIGFIEASHILEHIQNIIPLMNELYRIMIPKSQLMIKVPCLDGIWADPTHVRAFSPLSWRYYCEYPFSKSYGITTKFKIISNVIIPNNDGGENLVILEKVE